jgi:hypothetical protein
MREEHLLHICVDSLYRCLANNGIQAFDLPASGTLDSAG